MNLRLLSVLFIYLAVGQLSGDDVSPLEAPPIGFQVPGEKDPYGNLSPPRQQVERQREQQQGYIRLVTQSRRGYLDLIRYLDLYEELETTASQTQQLSNLSVLQPAKIKNEILKDASLPVSDKRYDSFLISYRQKFRRHRNESDKAVALILTSQQLQRLKEICFQFYFIHQGDPKKAFSICEETLPEGKLKLLLADMKEAYGVNFRGERFAYELNSRLEVLYNVFGSSARQAAGDTYNFLLGGKYFPAPGETSSADQKSNRRRN